jgi:hypothetical protein
MSLVRKELSVWFAVVPLRQQHVYTCKYRDRAVTESYKINILCFYNFNVN